MEDFIPTTDFKQVCLRPECEGETFLDLKDKDGNISPARKCEKCGLVSTMFKTKL